MDFFPLEDSPSRLFGRFTCVPDEQYKQNGEFVPPGAAADLHLLAGDASGAFVGHRTCAGAAY